MTQKMYKQLFKSFDYFGVHFNFHYKSKEKFYSETGGFIFLCFVLITITYILVNVFDFVGRKNYSIIYYTLQMASTDVISMQNYSTNIGFGLECDLEEQQSRLYDMFKLKFTHVSMKKNDGVITKEKKVVNLAPCQKEDFFNEFNATFDEINLTQFFCPIEKNYTTQGIYSDDVFTYYEIIVSIKEETEKNWNDVINGLTNSECHLTYYFVDTAIHLNDYKHPIRRFLNTNFISLKPDLFEKMNLYFKVQQFDSYENYLFEKHDTKYYFGFSNIEPYSTFKGLDRAVTKPQDYEKFAKIYIRSALNRNIISRKYMKLTEFAANMSSILSQILLFLLIFVTYINRFYSHISIMKHIFEFKETNSKRTRMLKEKYQTFFPQGEFKLDNAINYTQIPTKQFHIKQSLDESNGPLTISKNISNNLSINNTSEIKQKNTNDNSNIAPNVIGVQNEICIKKTHSNKFFIRKRERKKKDDLDIKYNIIELAFSMLCQSCSWKKLQMKNVLLEKGKRKLFYHLDILTYLKNMQMLEIINFIVLKGYESVIVRFISKPSISIANKIDVFEQIQNRYNYNTTEKEIIDFFQSIKYLHEKDAKSDRDRKLINIAGIELNHLMKSE